MRESWEYQDLSGPVEFKPAPRPEQADPAVMLWLPMLTVMSMVFFGVLLFKYSDLLFKIIVTVVLCGPFVWLLVSSFRGAMPERECPGCKQESLVLLDPQEEHGVRCLHCDFRDEELRLPYMKDLMNDPEIAAQAGYVIDEYGQAHLPSARS